MDREGRVPANKSSKIEEDEITTKDYIIVQTVYDNAVDKSGHSSVVDLTDDAWILVFDYLDFDDRTRIARVCRRWSELARISWKIITRLSFPNGIFKPLVDSHQLTSYLLEVILPKCGKRLRSLNLSGLFFMTTADSDIHALNFSKTLAERLPKLRSLNLKYCRFLSDIGLWWALRMLQSLTSLNVGYNESITGDFFSQAPQSLTEVLVEGCSSLTDEGVRLLAKRCPNLEAIDISVCHSLTGRQSITALTTNCSKLKRFYFRQSICNAPLTSHLLTLSNLPLLEELHVDGHYNVTDEVFKELGRHCPLLRSISCVGCIKLSDAAILHLSPCLHLESINLSSTYITDEGLNRLSLVHSELKKVYLRGCQSITNKGVGHLLSAHHNLLELNIKYCRRVTDGVLPILKSSLHHRQHTQPLKIYIEGTSVDPGLAVSFEEQTIGCNLVELFFEEI